MSVIERLKNEVLVIDGAMGTMLLDSGIAAGACLEELNISNPDAIKKVHQAYVDAGADIIETNCFGGNRIKLKESGLDDKVREINFEGVKIAKEVAGGKVFVAANIGPTGKLLAPMGELSFDEAYKAFAEQAKIFEEAGAALISVETMTDIEELKIAVMAAKENTKLPVISSMTFEDNGLTVTGTPPEVLVLVAQSVGADIIGANCSNGPKILLPVMKKIAKHSTRPIIVMPNAGFPRLVGNRAVYDMTPQVFGEYAEKFLKMGINIIGGCCGTEPKHIEKVKEIVVRGQGPVVRKIISLAGFASRTRVIEYKKFPIIIGERINPTGKKMLQEEIKSGKASIIRSEAVSQEKAGADLIDVNVGVPDVDPVTAMKAAVHAVSSSVGSSVSIDSPKPEALEAGLKTFAGKPLINSVTGKESSLSKVLPMVKRYGAAVIGLCLDDSGIPETAEGRLKVAEKIISRAAAEGISKEDIFIDPLVMSAGVGVEKPLETLKALKLIKDKLGVKTVLGISNVSHGMPDRSRLNLIYLKLALLYGVDAIIIDPTDKEMMRVARGQGLGTGEKQKTLMEEFKEEVERARRGKVKGKRDKAYGEKEKIKAVSVTLSGIKNSVIEGDPDKVKAIVEKLLLKKTDPQKIMDLALVPGMEAVGKRFSKGIYFLPQVVSSAEAMKAGFELVKAKLAAGRFKTRGTVVLATVRGDIHDIGKNIVRMMLENSGFKVVDLGKDVPPDKIVDAVKEENAQAVALSSLLTTTMPEMEVVKADLKEQGINIPVIVGGAVVTKEFARRIGAEYGRDAVSAVDIAKRIIKGIPK